MIPRSFELSLRKGAIGEQVCRDILERKGWVVYQPATEGAHAFDMLAILNKQRAVAIDVKAKARLNHWRATGINQAHFETYKAFSEKHAMPFWLFFVDECEHAIYGNELSILETPVTIDGHLWPRVMKWKPPIRLWHLDQMRLVCSIDDAIAYELAELSQRSYAYTPSEV